MTNRTKAVLTVFLAFASAAPAAAGPIEDARTAYVRGDFTTAIRIIRPLAEQGDAIAQYNLGYMYAHGQGVAENDTEAIKWLYKAAEQGYAAAYYSLGVMYEHGQGVVQDFVQAYVWFSLAAVGASASEPRRRKNAISARDKLAAKMSPAQVAQAQKLASEWKPNKN
jgi:TPR repeat protein